MYILKQENLGIGGGSYHIYIYTYTHAHMPINDIVRFWVCFPHGSGGMGVCIVALQWLRGGSCKNFRFESCVGVGLTGWPEVGGFGLRPIEAKPEVGHAPGVSTPFEWAGQNAGQPLSWACKAPPAFCGPTSILTCRVLHALPFPFLRGPSLEWSIRHRVPKCRQERRNFFAFGGLQPHGEEAWGKAFTPPNWSGAFGFPVVWRWRSLTSISFLVLKLHSFLLVAKWVCVGIQEALKWSLLRGCLKGNQRES